MPDLDMQHFEELRRRIKQRLEELETRHHKAQINDFPWLYGALGEVPSDAMFLCETFRDKQDGCTKVGLTP